MAAGEIYEQTARLVLEASEQGKPLRSLFKTHCPWIETQLRRAAKCPGLLGLWGRSLNYDEHAKAIIVEPPILRIIGELAGVALRGRIVHAGLEHTYGYLFSLIETPFGKKRERWLLPDLDQGFGFDVPTLRDQPQAGTLLLNLTYCLARIAFRDQPGLLNHMLAEETAIAPWLWEFAFDKLAIRRVVEQVTIPAGRRQGTRIELHTDLVSLPHGPSNESTLLVYSVVNGPRLGPQLITAFLIAKEPVREITSPDNQGEEVEVRARYNAYVEGLTGRTLIGRRFLVQ